MPRLDLYHHTVKRALEKEQWVITDDPLELRIGKKRLYADFGAGRLVGAIKAQQKIAVEVKSFVGVSTIKDLEQAVGQYVVYQKILHQNESDRFLYLAISTLTYTNVFEIEIGQLLLADDTIRLIVFDSDKEVITQWIPKIDTKV